MSSKHQNRIFNVEYVELASLLFLDAKVCCKSDRYLTRVYKKPAFGGFFSNHESFISTNRTRKTFIQITEAAVQWCS